MDEGVCNHGGMSRLEVRVACGGVALWERLGGGVDEWKACVRFRVSLTWLRPMAMVL